MQLHQHDVYIEKPNISSWTIGELVMINQRKWLQCSKLLSSAATISLFAYPAFAQSKQDTAAENPTVAGSGNEIIVTARKRGENLVDVPVAISAISAEDLALRGIKGFNELNDFVPGLRYENSAANRNDRSFHTITMRGMFPGDAPNRPAVTVFVDGAPIPGGSIPGLSDIARVEVVKGPQSAYFGRSTFAGALNFITAPPSLTNFRIKADASMASFKTTDNSVAVDIPVIQDVLAVRLGGRYYHTDGQYDNFGYAGRLGERNTTSFSATIYAKPTPGITMRGFVVTWKDDDGPSAQSALHEKDYNCTPGGNGRLVNDKRYICGGLGATVAQRMSQNNTTDTSLLISSANVLPAGFVKSLGLQREETIANLGIDFDLGGDYTLSTNVGANHNKWAALTDTYNRPPDGTGYYSTVYLPYNLKNKSGEVRLTSPSDGALLAMVGANYYQESIKFAARALRPIAGVPTIINLSQPTDYRAKTIGLFGSLNYDISDALSVSAEARYQWDTIHHIVTPIGSLVPTVDLEDTYKSFSPRVIATYKLTEDANIYLSWASGTRPGVFNSNFPTYDAFQQGQINTNAGGVVPLAVPQEKINSFEFGFKSELFDRRLRILLATYYAEWRDRQISQNIPYFATPTSTTTSTATLVFPKGATDLWGIELEANFDVNDAISIDGTFNWAHTQINFTSCGECLVTSGVANPAGNMMERYPEFSGSLGINYSKPISTDWTFNARSDLIYTGKQYATADNLTWLKASNRVNINIGVSTETYKIEVFARNLFDDKVPSNILRNANPNSLATQGSNTIILAAPDRQSFGIRFGIKY
jgi:iron complex outermembrane receptor protein